MARRGLLIEGPLRLLLTCISAFSALELSRNLLFYDFGRCRCCAKHIRQFRAEGSEHVWCSEEVKQPQLVTVEVVSFPAR